MLALYIRRALEDVWYDSDYILLMNFLNIAEMQMIL